MRRVMRLLLAIAGLCATPATAAPFAFSSHGAVLHGELIIPPHPRASVVLIHGSGPDGAADYAAQARLFASLGVAALAYDKRGWQASGGDWRQRPVGLLGDDAVAAGQALRQQLHLPVGYWGISQGGWVLARVGATDPSAAFLIGVAAAGVTPFQQERWHKQQMLGAAGYPPWARTAGDRFWVAALDLMTRLETHPAFLPGLLTNERAGSSFGLDWSPLPDWRRSRAPLLLLYGSRDQLEPWFDSGLRIAAVRAAGSATQVRVIAGSSHALTTRQTGLAFDWGEAMAPAYSRDLETFVSAALHGTVLPDLSRPAPAPWPDRSPAAAPITLAILTFFPLLMIAAMFVRRSRLAFGLGLAGLAQWGVLAALLAKGVFPAGSFYDPATRFPAWGWFALILGLVASAIGLVATLSFRQRSLVRVAGAANLLFALFWYAG